MKVLIFCPTARIEAETIVSIFNQDYSRFDVLLTKDNPYEGKEIFRNIQRNLEKMRLIALSQNYDKVLVVESDMVIPMDALSKLIETNAPIVTGLYGLRHGTPVPNIQPLGSERAAKGFLTWEDVRENWGKTIEVDGGCLGCVLIDKSVLQKYSFELGNNDTSDVPFMRYCISKGIKQLARLDVVCGHIKLNHEIIWPDEKQGYRIERIN